MFGNKPHTITITLNKDGTMESRVEGVKGPSCEELTAWLEQLGETVEHGKTPDYWQSDDQGVGLVSKF